jgi:hypothetical protein
MDPKLRWNRRVYLGFLHSRCILGVHVHFGCYNAHQGQYETERMIEVGFMLSENVSLVKATAPVSEMAAGKLITKKKVLVVF